VIFAIILIIIIIIWQLVVGRLLYMYETGIAQFTLLGRGMEKWKIASYGVLAHGYRRTPMGHGNEPKLTEASSWEVHVFVSVPYTYLHPRAMQDNSGKLLSPYSGSEQVSMSHSKDLIVLAHHVSAK